MQPCQNFLTWIIEVAGARTTAPKLEEKLIKQDRIEVVNGRIHNEVFVMCRLATAAQVAEYLVLGHLSVSVAAPDIGSAGKPCRFVKTRLLVGGDFFDLRRNHSFAIDLVQNELRA